MRLLSLCLLCALFGCSGVVVGALYFTDKALDANVTLGACYGHLQDETHYFKLCTQTIENSAGELYECEQRLLTCAKGERE